MQRPMNQLRTNPVDKIILESMDRKNKILMLRDVTYSCIETKPVNESNNIDGTLHIHKK